MKNEDEPQNKPTPKNGRKFYNQNLPLPSEIIDLVKQKMKEASESHVYYKLSMSITEMPDIDLTDSLAVHGMFEQQTNLLNKVFHLTLLDGHRQDIELALKIQRAIHNNLPVLDRYQDANLEHYYERRLEQYYSSLEHAADSNSIEDKRMESPDAPDRERHHDRQQDSTITQFPSTD